MEDQKLIKVIFVGDAGVGKTSIMLRAAEDTFSASYAPTIGVEFMTIKSSNFKLQLWDTAGQERFRNMSRAFYRGTHVTGLVFDVASRRSFEHLEGWLTEATNEAPGAVLLLVGSKTDLANREVTMEEGEAFAAKNNMLYLEFSAKTGHQKAILGKLEEAGDKVLASAN